MSHAPYTWVAGANPAITKLNAIEQDLAAVSVAAQNAGVHVLEADADIGSLSVTLKDTPPWTAGLGFAVLEPYTSRCEIRKIDNVSGNTLTLKAGRPTATSSRLQFIAASKTIRYSRGISSISGDGATVTVACDTDHPFAVSDSITIYGTEAYDGTYTVASVNHATHEITFASAITGAESAGWVRNSNDASLMTLFKDSKVQVSGSSSNNGTYTVDSVFRYGSDGTKSTYRSDPYAVTVAEALVDENAAGGTTISLAVGTNYDHAADSAVMIVMGSLIDAVWYGVKGDANTASATANTSGLNHATNDAYHQAFGGIQCPPGTIYVNDEIFVDAGIIFCGASIDSTIFSATTSGSTEWASGFKSGEVAIIHPRRDGDPCKFTTSGSSPRQWFRFFVIAGNNICSSSGTDGVANDTTTFTAASAAWDANDVGKIIVIADPTLATDGVGRMITAVNSSTSVTVSGAALPAATGLTWKVGGANGLLAGPQQPADWHAVRANTCLGYGICLADVQQHTMFNTELIGNGVALWCRSAGLLFVYVLNMEQSVAVDCLFDKTSDGGGGYQNSFWGVHCESACAVAFDNLEGMDGLFIDGAWHSNPATGAFIRSRSKVSWHVRNLRCNANSLTYKMIDDQGRDWSITSWNTDTDRKIMFAAAHDDQIIVFTTTGLRVIGDSQFDSLKQTARTITASDTLATDDSILLVDATAGNVDVTFGSVASYADKAYVIKRIDSSAHSVNLWAVIDGVASPAISLAALEWATLYSDGTNLWRIGG